MPSAVKTSPQSARRNVQQQIDELSARIAKFEQAASHSLTWWHDHAGRFENDPVFDEIARLGKAYRLAQQPKQRAKRARSRH